MTDRSIAVIGLPGSGKTTYLAALWHILIRGDVPTAMTLENLLAGDATHLNALATRWREAKEQDRTDIGGNQLVSMNLLDENKAPIRVTFPDVAGEAYRRIWEDRECDPQVAEQLQTEGVLLFVHADTIRAPTWVVDEAALSREMGIEAEPVEPVPWHPRLAPTQVQLVGLLRSMTVDPIRAGPRRLAIVLSAWDKAAGEQLNPQEYLERKLPLLAQYIRQATGYWTAQIYGLSAQGGEYDPADPDKPRREAAAVLRRYDQPSIRISLVPSSRSQHDLTEPLSWLMA